MNTTEQTSSLPSARGENGVKLLLKYFPDLTEEQRKQFAALYELYIDWNSKINVISRKDIENLYEHHVLHSLGIARVIRFRSAAVSWTSAPEGDSPEYRYHSFSGHEIPSGGQHRQESTCGNRGSQCHRT